jgi:hypothetical protein
MVGCGFKCFLVVVYFLPLLRHLMYLGGDALTPCKCAPTRGKIYSISLNVHMPPTIKTPFLLFQIKVT